MAIQAREFESDTVETFITDAIQGIQVRIVVLNELVKLGVSVLYAAFIFAPKGLKERGGVIPLKNANLVAMQEFVKNVRRIILCVDEVENIFRKHHCETFICINIYLF